MRVFLTGATGFIGSHIVPELLAAGHQVIGMTRSDAGAKTLAAVGAEAHFSTLEDLDSIIAGAQKADAVIHTAFDHDFSNFVANCEKDRRVIAALGSVLNGSSRPLIITSGVAIGAPEDGTPARENVFNAQHPNPRVGSELEGHKQLEAGVDVRVVRLPQVHNTFKQGLITPYIEMSREKGQAGFVNEGNNSWSAAHVQDVARLYALVLDQGSKGERYHAVDEEGVTARHIAEVVATGLGIPAVSLTPEEAQQQLGWFAMFAALDLKATGAWTQQRLGWKPVGVGLIEDLQNMPLNHKDN